MPEVGEKIVMPDSELRKVCEGDECRGKPFELGKLYVVKGEVEGGRLPEDFGGAVWEVLKSVRREYPGVSITYIWVSSDGGEFEVHLFDPQYALFPWAIVAVLVLILGILVAATVLVRVVIWGWEKVKPYVPKPPPMPQTPWFWWAVVGVAGAFAVAGVIKAVKK